MSDNTKYTLVLGGTGKTGSRIVERLHARGLPVRIGSRSAEPPFDWDNPATWAPVLLDVEAVYITFQPDLAVPGAPDAVRAFGEMAATAGVRRMVLLSGRGEEEAQAAERLLAEVHPGLTVIRSSFFAQNFDEGHFAAEIKAGRLVLPVGEVAEPFIDIDDIADLAVAALTGDGHAGQVYEVTGPRLLTFAEAIAEIATAAGRPIEFLQIPADDYAAGARAQGLPDELVDFLVYLFTTVLDGRNAHVTDDIERGLGRAPGDFADYVRKTAATGVWTV
ncbi:MULTISPECIES: NmrA family transcriptional regulator [unclassified Nocardia]|uniref:NmrA family transcriptional regulator n=1 Tax=unclassified Nocardia TaxID=2637762 RepID=UPI0024A8E37B|nr:MULTISPECIES: NmrA family transcriptional regulator [unclassified Nocardia]